MPKPYREWRTQATQINDAAKAQGQPEPIPDAGKLRKADLAKQVIQYSLNSGGQS